LWRHFPAKNVAIRKTKNIRFLRMTCSMSLRNFVETGWKLKKLKHVSALAFIFVRREILLTGKDFLRFSSAKDLGMWMDSFLNLLWSAHYEPKTLECISIITRWCYMDCFIAYLYGRTHQIKMSWTWNKEGFLQELKLAFIFCCPQKIFNRDLILFQYPLLKLKGLLN
jgi:hypothetical protein